MSISPEIAERVVELQDALTRQWHGQADQQKVRFPIPDIAVAVTELHRQNFDLWNLEDQSRSTAISDHDIAEVKRKIDMLKLRRSQIIAEIDIQLNKRYFPKVMNGELPWNSESVGNIIDRLSIGSLRTHVLGANTSFEDALDFEFSESAEKMALVSKARDDLKTSLKVLVEEILEGSRQNKIQYQIKLYNDPEFNPHLNKS